MSTWTWDNTGSAASYDVDTDTYRNMPPWYRDAALQRMYEQAVATEWAND